MRKNCSYGKVFILAVLGLCLIGASLIGQTAIQVPAKPKTQKEVKTFVNSQGFKLPASLPTSTLVYQGAKGGYYILKVSKKTGKEYKSYLPKQ